MGHKRKSDTDATLERKAARVESAAPEVPASQVNLIEAEGKSCTHEVAWPPGAVESCSSLPPQRKQGPPARNFAFSLDPFQQTSVNCLEAGELGFLQICYRLCSKGGLHGSALVSAGEVLLPTE